MANAIAVAVAAGACGGHGQIAQRSQNKDRAPLTSNEDIRLALRLSDHQIDLLKCEYNAWRQNKFGISPTVDRSEVRMMAFLAFLARGGYYHQVARAEGVAKSTLIMYVKEVADFFSDTAHNCISLPGAAELNGLSLPLQDQHTPQVSRCSQHVYRYSKSFILYLLQYHENYETDGT